MRQAAISPTEGKDLIGWWFPLPTVIPSSWCSGGWRRIRFRCAQVSGCRSRGLRMRKDTNTSRPPSMTAPSRLRLGRMALPSRDRQGAGHAHPDQRGAITIEYVIAFATMLLPMTMMIIFTAQLLWVWHSVTDFTRTGARYA